MSVNGKWEMVNGKAATSKYSAANEKLRFEQHRHFG